MVSSMAAALLALAIAIAIVLMVIGLWKLAYRLPMIGGPLALVVIVDGIDEWQRVIDARHPMPAIPIAIVSLRLAVGAIALIVAAIGMARGSRLRSEA